MPGWRSERRNPTDGTTTRYGLSPHPALLLVVEGPTEQDLLPKVMRLLDIPTADTFIRIVTLGGVEKQIELLARYLAPRLRMLDDKVADMLRPPIRVLVVMDAEGRYATRALRDERQREWVMHIWNVLEPGFRTDAARADLAHMVAVTTWRPRTKDLEYAHFTARQLARAIIRTGRAKTGETVEALEADIRHLKARGKSVDKVWRSWPDPRPDMVALWSELWPLLERRIVRASRNPDAGKIPVCRVLLEAYRQAARPRRHVVMRY